VKGPVKDVLDVAGLSEELGEDRFFLEVHDAVEAAEAEVRTRFSTAALARSRVNRPGRTDLHRLWRTPVQRSDGHDFFVAKAAGGLRLEGELRDLVAKAKYRGATR